ncbi:TrmH family RNA methyltransferase [Candidatus Saccharibacteria bacterium]|nr:TrmH family RNA methyltransferase [Candidatus Saccharibacteria bacterium]
MILKVVLHNIRSTYNVGAILRTCEGFGVDEVVLSGYTPRYDDKSLLPHLRDKLNKQIAKTALGAEELLNIYSSGDIFTDLTEWKKQGFKIVGLENNIQDVRLKRLNDSSLKDEIGEKIALILGEEVEGINSKLYKLIDIFVEIPMRGKKESFNVSVATGIAIYELTKKDSR